MGDTGAVDARPETQGPGKKKLGVVQFSALDPLAVRALAEHAGRGAQKYSRFNFLAGYEWSASVDALMRHLLAFLSGEDVDGETGSLHMTAVMWHAHALVAFQLRGLGTDDRFRPNMNGGHPW